MKKTLWAIILSLVALLVACTVFDYVRGNNLSKQASELLQKEVAENNLQQMQSLCQIGATRRFEWGGFRCVINTISIDTLMTLSGEELQALHEGTKNIHRVNVLLFRYNQGNPEGALYLTFNESKELSSATYTHHFNTLLEDFGLEWYLF